MYRYLLWDIDGTVLDFIAAEKAAIKSLFIKYGFGQCSDEMVADYSRINVKYWHKLEKNEMTKPQILEGRFNEFFTLYSIDTKWVAEFNKDYQLALGDTIAFCDDALNILKNQKDKYILVAITNGTAAAQHKKLTNSGLDKIFDYIFISEEVGYEKPNKEFFDEVIKKVGIDSLKNALIIGDSLSSDIRGGINAGIDTCWYNPAHLDNPYTDVVPKYEINDLHEVEGLLAEL